MRMLVVEDSFLSRTILLRLLAPYGECDVAVNGDEALEAFEQAWSEGKPYRLICLDLMMPHTDGGEALRRIRGLERKRGVGSEQAARVIITSGHSDPGSAGISPDNSGPTAFLTKPVTKEGLEAELKKLSLTDQEGAVKRP